MAKISECEHAERYYLNTLQLTGLGVADHENSEPNKISSGSKSVDYPAPAFRWRLFYLSSKNSQFSQPEGGYIEGKGVRGDRKRGIDRERDR